LKALIARNPIRQVEFRNGLDETLKFKSRSDVPSSFKSPALLLSKRAILEIKKSASLIVKTNFRKGKLAPRTGTAPFPSRTQASVIKTRLLDNLAVLEQTQGSTFAPVTRTVRDDIQV
jgi:hypothetical protein